MPLSSVPFDAPPFRLSGVVYGTLLNHRDALETIGAAAHEAPYKAPPRAVVLYLKPRNTFVRPGEALWAGDDGAEVEVGSSLGLVIGRVACRVDEADALDHLAGYTIVHDVSLPHSSYYRPQIRLKARDRSCAVGPRVVARGDVGDPLALRLRVFVDGQPVLEQGLASLVRSPARLLAEVTDFMTLSPGDILMVGVGPGAPRVKAGQHIVTEIDGLGRLEGRFVAPSGEAS